MFLSNGCPDCVHVFMLGSITGLYHPCWLCWLKTEDGAAVFNWLDLTWFYKWTAASERKLPVAQILLSRGNSDSIHHPVFLLFGMVIVLVPFLISECKICFNIKVQSWILINSAVRIILHLNNTNKKKPDQSLKNEFIMFIQLIVISIH